MSSAEQPRADERKTPLDPEAIGLDVLQAPTEEDETAAGRPQRTRKPSLKVIENKLIQTKKSVDKLWKLSVGTDCEIFGKPVS